MEVSPKTLREVEFREKMRGYHPEDVDQFLEQVAAGIEVLQDRLRQAVERAQRAEAAASESGGADETLRKTLVLAQRTADMAVQEAREQASRILASAEQQAQSILAEAEERGRRTLEETIAECKAELGRLEANRAQAQQDVETLQRWLDEHKEHLRATLSEALSAVDRAGVLWPAPSTRSVDPGPRRAAPSAPPPVEREPVGANGVDTGPDTVMWSPAEEDLAGGGAPVGAMVAAEAAAPPSRAPEPPAAAHVPLGADPDEQALDDFFDDNNDLDDEPRFGGRLRRRR
ncbi:MAG TPA: DivIVA domain-containing protein [Acidimicrobiales bacterium]|nr:DivIVA domain-containing protein [Acidimicrobiales bacterium]